MLFPGDVIMAKVVIAVGVLQTHWVRVRVAEVGTDDHITIVLDGPREEVNPIIATVLGVPVPAKYVPGWYKRLTGEEI